MSRTFMSADPPSLGVGVPGQAQGKVPLYVAPFGGKDAEDHRIAGRAVTARLMMTENTVLLRSERRDRALRCDVEAVGAEPDDGAAESLESMRQEQQLARRVHVRSLPARRVP